MLGQRADSKPKSHQWDIDGGLHPAVDGQSLGERWKKYSSGLSVTLVLRTLSGGHRPVLLLVCSFCCIHHYYYHFLLSLSSSSIITSIIVSGHCVTERYPSTIVHDNGDGEAGPGLLHLTRPGAVRWGVWHPHAVSRLQHHRGPGSDWVHLLWQDGHADGEQDGVQELYHWWCWLPTSSWLVRCFCQPVSLYVCLSLFVCVCVCVCLSLSLSLSLSFSLSLSLSLSLFLVCAVAHVHAHSVCPSVSVSVSVCVSLSVSVSLSLSVCLSVSLSLSLSLALSLSLSLSLPLALPPPSSLFFLFNNSVSSIVEQPSYHQCVCENVSERQNLCFS